MTVVPVLPAPRSGPCGRMLMSAPLLSPAVRTEQVSKSTASTPPPPTPGAQTLRSGRQPLRVAGGGEAAGLRTDLGLRLPGSKAGSATSSLGKRGQIPRLCHASVSVKGGFPSWVVGTSILEGVPHEGLACGWRACPLGEELGGTWPRRGTCQ